jgi:hypothetical protein
MITIGGLTAFEARELLNILLELRENPSDPAVTEAVEPTWTPCDPKLREGPEPLAVAPMQDKEITFATLLQRITAERVAGTRIAEVLGDKMLPAIATDSAEIRRVYDELFGSD